MSWMAGSDNNCWPLYQWLVQAFKNSTTNGTRIKPEKGGL
jgi:hypothetical protein